jgi:hypothetical protein
MTEQKFLETVSPLFRAGGALVVQIMPLCSQRDALERIGNGRGRPLFRLKAAPILGSP